MLSRQILVILNLFVLAACSTVEKQHRTVYNNTIEPDNAITIQQASLDSVLRVATLNLAHGLSLIHISEPTRLLVQSRMPSSA